jgi:hypothetical protein
VQRSVGVGVERISVLSAMRAVLCRNCYRALEMLQKAMLSRRASRLFSHRSGPRRAFIPLYLYSVPTHVAPDCAQAGYPYFSLSRAGFGTLALREPGCRAVKGPVPSRLSRCLRLYCT